MSDNTCLVTGATGFVGKPLIEALRARAYPVRAALHRAAALPMPGVEAVSVGDIDGATDWKDTLQNVDCVFHLAARVHVMHDTAADPLAEFRRINVDGTRRLLDACAASGVRRFVFVSSIKVNGEGTTKSSPYDEKRVPQPVDPYGISKWEAEQLVSQFAAAQGMEFVIVRPPMMYGPGVKANFLSLMRWVDHGVPLPLRNARNARSLLGVRNLADFLVRCADHPQAAGETFLLSDNDDLSTPELIRRLAHALGTAPRLLPAPESLLRMGFRAIGREPMLDRLFGSLVIDSSKARTRLDWSPPYSVDAGLAETAAWYHQAQAERAD